MIALLYQSARREDGTDPEIPRNQKYIHAAQEKAGEKTGFRLIPLKTENTGAEVTSAPDIMGRHFAHSSTIAS